MKIKNLSKLKTINVSVCYISTWGVFENIKENL